MLCACISHDNVTQYVDETNEGYEISWTENTVTVKLLDSTVTFQQNTESLSYRVLEQLIEYRRIYGSDNPIASASIKAATNSLYGSLGYEKSPLYSPRASRCVTAKTRCLLVRAKNIFIECGLDVIYGDTDSLFVTKLNSTKDLIKEAVDKALVRTT